MLFSPRNTSLKRLSPWWILPRTNEVTFEMIILFNLPLRQTPQTTNHKRLCQSMIRQWCLFMRRSIIPCWHSIIHDPFLSIFACTKPEKYRWIRNLQLLCAMLRTKWRPTRRTKRREINQWSVETKNERTLKIINERWLYWMRRWVF